jgi:tripartite-type tricarboxylate transporter receptor subunit TctC
VARKYAMSIRPKNESSRPGLAERRRVVTAGLASCGVTAFTSLAGGLMSRAAQAQASSATPGAAAGYPNRPIRIFVGYSAGGAVDAVARAVSASVAPTLGQSLVVENRPGAGSNLAARAVVDAPADGYTLLMAANAVTANMALYQPPPFDVEKDLVPVALIGRVPVVLAANPSAPFAAISALIAAAKAQPGRLSYASPGNGSTPHMAIEFFERAAGISLQHVPYRGGSQAITDVIGGQLPLVAVNALEVQSHVRTGRLKVIAVLSPNRSPIFPDVPTIAESGFPGFEASVWYGLMAPSATPPNIVTRLHGEVQRALGTAELRERMSAVGGEVLPGSVDMFRTLIRSERVRYERLVREANIKAD